MERGRIGLFCPWPLARSHVRGVERGRFGLSRSLSTLGIFPLLSQPLYGTSDLSISFAKWIGVERGRIGLFCPWPLARSHVRGVERGRFGLSRSLSTLRIFPLLSQPLSTTLPQPLSTTLPQPLSTASFGLKQYLPLLASFDVKQYLPHLASFDIKQYLPHLTSNSMYLIWPHLASSLSLFSLLSRQSDWLRVERGVERGQERPNRPLSTKKFKISNFDIISEIRCAKNLGSTPERMFLYMM